MAAKLKVFTWSDGFHAYTVATTSRAKALAAWGVGRDLFKDGDAAELDAGADHDAALAKPGETIRRGLNVDIGNVSTVAKPKPARRADVERVATLERELADLTAARDQAAAALAERRRRLEEDEADLESEFRDRSGAVAKALAAARRKLRG